MNAEDFLKAAVEIEQVDESDGLLKSPLLQDLKLCSPDGRCSISRHEVPAIAKLLRVASRMERVFSVRLPWNPQMFFFGASATMQGGQGSQFSGDGAPMRTDYGGVGFTALQAFCACAGEAAEHDAMLMRHDDPRINADGTVELLGLNFLPEARMKARSVLRRAGAVPDAHPRTSTGYAAGQNLRQAAESAALECIERHALSLWFSGDCGLVDLTPAITPGTAWAQHLRFAEGGVKFFLVRHDQGDMPVVVALSHMADGEIAVGYGCAGDEHTAALKAYREACQNEFGLQLDARNARTAERSKTGDPFVHLARSAMFRERQSLFDCDESRKMKTGPGQQKNVLARINSQARFADLTVPSEGIPVVCAFLPGLRDITAERQGRVPWPV